MSPVRLGLCVLIALSTALFPFRSAHSGYVSYMTMVCGGDGVCYEFNVPRNINPPGGCRVPCHWL